MKSDPILFAIPVFLLLIVLEIIIGHRQNKKVYRFNDAITNLGIGIGNQVMGVLTIGAILWLMTIIHKHFAIFDLPKNIWTVIFAVFLYDFLFYWSHRWSHEISFFWGAHVVHHQSEEYNLSVALRQPWFHHLIMFFMFIPLPLIGVPPEVFLPVSAFITLYQFWIHTKVINKMPRWFEFFFNTPSHHRVHHAIDPKYIDKNHAGFLIIWDRMFGTFKAEEEEPTYGITTQFKSWNPLWSNLHYYVELFEKMKHIKTFREKVKLVFSKPGWQPEYLGGYQAPPPVDEERAKFDTSFSKPVMRYAAIQFILCIAGLVAYMTYFPELSLFFKLTFAALIIVTLIIIGAIMEQKSWIKYIEHTRLGLVLISLNSLYYINYADWFTVMLIVSLIGFIGLTAWYTVRLHFSRQFR